MSDPVPTSRKVPPLAIIVVVVLVALAVVAFANMGKKAQTPSGTMGAPQEKPAAEAPVMPQTSNAVVAPPVTSDEKGAMGHQGTADDRVDETTANRVAAPAR